MLALVRLTLVMLTLGRVALRLACRLRSRLRCLWRILLMRIGHGVSRVSCRSG